MLIPESQARDLRYHLSLGPDAIASPFGIYLSSGGLAIASTSRANMPITLTVCCSSYYDRFVKEVESPTARGVLL